MLVTRETLEGGQGGEAKVWELCTVHSYFFVNLRHF